MSEFATGIPDLDSMTMAEFIRWRDEVGSVVGPGQDVSQRGRHRWTEEDAAYAAAQWASGIKQRDIAKVFGHAKSSAICTKIGEFLEKYTEGDELERWDGYGRLTWAEHRKSLIKPAIARFVEARLQRVGGVT